MDGIAIKRAVAEGQRTAQNRQASAAVDTVVLAAEVIGGKGGIKYLRVAILRKQTCAPVFPDVPAGDGVVREPGIDDM